MMSAFQKKRLYQFMVDRGGCVCCGTKKKLTFHHVDSAEKEGDIGDFSNPKDIVREVKKCIIVCRDCHSKYFHPFMDNFKHFYSKNMKYNFPKQSDYGYGVSLRDYMARDYYDNIQKREFCECCGKKKTLHRLIHPSRKKKINFDDIRANGMDYVSSVHMVCSTCSTKMILKYQEL